MLKAKRARNAETLKQPSLCLRLRATHFYPDGGMILSVSQVHTAISRRPTSPLVKINGPRAGGLELRKRATSIIRRVGIESREESPCRRISVSDKIQRTAHLDRYSHGPV